MNRPLLGLTFLLASALAERMAAAQPYPQPSYPPQPYPPQLYPQQSYPQQPFPQPSASPSVQPPPPSTPPNPQQAYQPTYQNTQVPGQSSQQGAAPSPTLATPPAGAVSPPAPSSLSESAAVSAAAPPASFGTSGHLILSVDRLFGVNFWSASRDLGNNQSISASNTSINFLWGDAEQTARLSNTTTVINPYAIPRLAADFVVANGISLGGSAAFVSRAGTTSQVAAAATTTRDSPSLTGFAVAPRVGYIVAPSSMFALWFKAGITFYSFDYELTTTQGNSSTTASSVRTGFSFDIEPEFVFLPTPNFGLTAKPIIDLALSGNAHDETTGASSTSQDNGIKTNNFGVAFGVLGRI